MAEKIIIASGKGGSGKTSLCTGVAMSFAQMGQNVLIVDCDIAQGCIEFMLDKEATSVYDWGDVINENCTAHEAVYTASGVDYMTAPKKWDDAFTQESFDKMISAVEGKYSFIFFDSPAGISGGFLLAGNCADRAIAVSTPDNVCVKAAARAIEELEALGIEDTKLVINRFDKPMTQKGKFLNLDETIDGVAAQLIGVVPEDKAITFASSTGFVELEDCPAKAAYERIALRISGLYVNLKLKNKKKKSKGKKAIAIIASLLAVVILFGCGVFVSDYISASKLLPPVFCKRVSISFSEGITNYKGFCYDYSVVEDEEGKIIATEMKVGGRVVSAAIV